MRRKNFVLTLFVVSVSITVVVLLGSLILNTSTNAPQDSSALVAGRLEFGYQYVGYVVSDTGKVCAGTLIDESTIITAGHCLSYEAGNSFKFGIGEFSLSKPLTAITVISYLAGFDPRTNDGTDIALARLESAISLPQYAKLSSSKPVEQCNYSIVAYGAGVESGSAPQSLFKKKAGEGCLKSISTSFLIDFNNEVGMCYGDSGGPIFREPGSNEIVGILSGGLVDSKLDKLRCDPGNIGLAYSVPGWGTAIAQARESLETNLAVRDVDESVSESSLLATLISFINASSPSSGQSSSKNTGSQSADNTASTNATLASANSARLFQLGILLFMGILILVCIYIIIKLVRK